MSSSAPAPNDRTDRAGGCAGDFGTAAPAGGEGGAAGGRKRRRHNMAMSSPARGEGGGSSDAAPAGTGTGADTSIGAIAEHKNPLYVRNYGKWESFVRFCNLPRGPLHVSKTMRCVNACVCLCVSARTRARACVCQSEDGLGYFVGVLS